MSKKLLALSLAFAFACAAAAFAVPRGEELRIGVTTDAKNFDPQNSIDTFSFSMDRQIYEPLFTFDGKTRKLIPVLAESYEVLDDCTYKFHLRKGVKFHNGDELTAEDVVYSYQRLLDKSRSLFAKSRVEWVDPNGFEIIDKYTLIMRTPRPFGALLQSMKHPCNSIFCKRAVEEAGADFFRKPCGTGPYKLIKWVKGERAEMEAFDDYWGEKPYAKKLTFLVLPDDSTRVIALETGRVDMIYGVPAADYDRLENNKDVKVVKNPGLVLLHMGMNMKSPKLKDPRVRHALDLAINKEAYIQVVYGGNGRVGRGPLPEASTFFPENPRPWPYDPEKAKKLLAEAAKDDPSLKNLELELWVINGADRINGATVIQNMLAEVGIKIKVVVYENAVISDKIREGKQELYVATWGMQTNRDPGTYWQNHFTNKAVDNINDSRFRDDLTNDYIVKGQSSLNEAERDKYYGLAFDRINEIHPWVYLCLADELIGARKDLVGVEDLVDGKINYLGNLHYPEQTERLK